MNKYKIVPFEQNAFKDAGINRSFKLYVPMLTNR